MSEIIIQQILEWKDNADSDTLRILIPGESWKDVKNYFVERGYMADVLGRNQCIAILGGNINSAYYIYLRWNNFWIDRKLILKKNYVKKNVRYCHKRDTSS